MIRGRFQITGCLLLCVLFLVGCGESQANPTSLPIETIPEAPIVTDVKSTETQVVPTATQIEPTATQFVATETEVKATNDDAADCERPDLPGVFVTQDVCNIQAAVNANPGGKILLKGTFHFAEYGDDGYVVPGTDGTVFITNDVEIIGEKKGDTFLTKIRGGYNTFSIGYMPIDWSYKFISDIKNTKTINAVPVKVTIQDIEFENSFFGAIIIWATTGATIKGNRIIDGRSIDLTAQCGFCHAQGFAIVAFPPGGWDKDNPHLISGNITIMENYIDGRYRRAEADDPWAVPSDGILIRGLTGGGISLIESEADITIKANELRNMWGGISSLGNAGLTIIENNLIYLPAQDPVLYLDYVFGIDFCAWCWNDAYETSKVIIKDNDITLGGHFATGNQWTIGIWVESGMNDPLVSENRINLLSDTFAGIWILDASTTNVTENIIEGEGQYGVALGHPEDPIEHKNNRNTVKENDLVDFSAKVSNYLLGIDVTNNEIYIDEDDTVLDESGNDSNFIYRQD